MSRAEIACTATARSVRQGITLALVALLTVALVACSGGSGGSGDAQELHLNVTNIGTDLSTLPMFVADAEGLFAKRGLTVTFTTASNINQPALLSSGETDLIYNSNGVAITSALKGQLAISVYGLNAYSYTVELWGGSKATSMQQIQQADSCRFATLPPGGPTYGYAQYWTEKFDLKCEITVASGNDAILSGIQAGTYDVGLIPRSSIGTVPDGINVLVPKTAQLDPTYPQVPGADKAEIAGLLGLPGNLNDKRAAVTAFIGGLVEAQQLIDTAPTERLAADVRENAIFAAVPAERIAQQVDTAKQATWKDPATGRPGYISEEVWNASLQAYSYWGIQNFAPDKPEVGYQKMIDMSYYDSATKA